MRLPRLCFALLVLLAFRPATAAVVEEGLDYRIDAQTYHGTLYYDDAAGKLQPLVLLIPNWLGVTPANLKQARQVAGTDYAVFVVDMYGKKHQPADEAAAGKAVYALYSNRAELRKRIVSAQNQAVALVQKKKLPVDPTKIAAVGFCFGGGVALELARSGAPLAGVVSFHGTLYVESPAPPPAYAAQTKLLILHGDADPFTMDQVEPFLREVREAKVDWQLVRYAGAVHSFTDVDAHTPGKAEYDPVVARRAYAAMREFLAEAFGG